MTFSARTQIDVGPHTQVTCAYVSTNEHIKLPSINEDVGDGGGIYYMYIYIYKGYYITLTVTSGHILKTVYRI